MTKRQIIPADLAPVVLHSRLLLRARANTGHSGAMLRRVSCVASIIAALAVAGCSSPSQPQNKSSASPSTTGPNSSPDTSSQPSTVVTATQPKVSPEPTTNGGASTIDSTVDTSTVTIGRQIEVLPPGSVVYTGPVIVSQGPAAAYVPGVGVVGTTRGDADRHFELAIVTDPNAPLIGVGVRLTPTLTGAPDGRLYVVDGDALSAYSFSNGIATRTDGPIGVGTGCKTIDVSATYVTCNQASIALGPIIDTTSWTTSNLDRPEPANVVFKDVTPDCATFFDPGCETWTIATGTQLWALQYEWNESGNNFYRTALIAKTDGRVSTTLIDGLVAALDPAGRVLYAWSSFNDLVTYDLANLLAT